MRIGVDLTCWHNHRGYGRYTRNLLRALLTIDQRHTYVGFTDTTTIAREAFPPGLTIVTVQQSEPPWRAASAYSRRKLADIWRMSQAVRRAGVDLMFFPTSYTFFPVLGKARCVVVVHDAIAERWPHLIFPSLAGRLAWMLKSRLACWQAHRVVTVSHAAARAIRQHLHVPAERLCVISEAPDPAFQVRNSSMDREQRRRVLLRYDIPHPAQLILYVGGFSPHKNVQALVSSFAQLLRTGLSPSAGADATVGAHTPLHLVLVGETTQEVFHSCYPALQEQVHRLHLEQHVTFTGYVPDDDLVHLYQAATCLVLPSRDEGFGLPAVEAMACGTPVVVSNAGALPELVGDAGLLVDPERTDELVAALRRLMSEPSLHADLRERGLRRAAQLSWEQAAADLLGVFDEAVPGPDRFSPRSSAATRT